MSLGSVDHLEGKQGPKKDYTTKQRNLGKVRTGMNFALPENTCKRI